MKRFAIAFLVLLTLVPSLVGAVDLKPNPSDCPKGPDGKAKYRCLTIDEYAAITEEYLTVKGRLDRLEWQRHTLGRFVEPWAQVGVEKLPNLNEYHPYGLVGLNLGRVSIWGGTFGDEPAYGIGWRVWPR